MSDYKLDLTDIILPPIVVGEKDIDTTTTDITLFGFKRLNYGQELNENFVHLLENFAAPEDPNNPGNPDVSQTNYISSANETKLLASGKQLIGQIWYNKTDQTPYIFYDEKWNKLENQGEEISANWGQILNGGQIPRPVSTSGYIFPYSECSWIVAPFNQLDELEQMVCRTDTNANVTMEYLFSGDSVETSAVANYMIVGIRGNVNLGSIQDPLEPQPTPSATPASSPIEGETPAPTSTPAPTPTPTPTPSSGGQLDPLSLSMTGSPYFASCSGLSTEQCTASKQIIPGSDYVVSGGSGNVTYTWLTSVSGSSFSVSNPNVANPVLSRRRSTGLSPSGTGTLEVSDTVTGEIVSRAFGFNTQHIVVSVEPSPTPTPAVSPSSTPAVTPTSTPAVTPTSTPAVTPSNTPVAELSTSESGTGIFFGVCDGSNPLAVPTLSRSFTVSGGSGNYNIQLAGGCTSPSGNNICGSVNVSTTSTGGSIVLPSFNYTGCPNPSGLNTAEQSFTITDTVTSQQTSVTLGITWEVAGSS